MILKNSNLEGKLVERQEKYYLKIISEIWIIRGRFKQLIVVKIHVLGQSIEILLIKIVSIKIILSK